MRLRLVCLAGLASLAASIVTAGGASAQYFDDGYRRGYDRGYDRYDGPRRYDRGGGYDRGYGYDRRNEYRGGGGYGPPPQARSRDPMAGMSLDERKQAIKNHREAQKKAIKRGYVIP